MNERVGRARARTCSPVIRGAQPFFKQRNLKISPQTRPKTNNNTASKMNNSTPQNDFEAQLEENRLTIATPLCALNRCVGFLFARDREREPGSRTRT